MRSIDVHQLGQQLKRFDKEPTDLKTETITVILMAKLRVNQKVMSFLEGHFSNKLFEICFLLID